MATMDDGDNDNGSQQWMVRVTMMDSNNNDYGDDGNNRWQQG